MVAKTKALTSISNLNFLKNHIALSNRISSENRNLTVILMVTLVTDTILKKINLYGKPRNCSINRF